MRLFHTSRFRRLAPLGATAALILAAASVSPGSARAATPATPSPRPGPATGAAASCTEQVDIVLWLMRQIYEILGGDPNDLDVPPDTQLNIIAGYFHTHGFPSLSQTDKDTALYDISQLQGYLSASPPPSGISSGAAASFLVVLNEMHTALVGGN